ncbi:oxygenase MpaB family protein [Nocardia sp. NBC_00511]|uniref:oxygenase MpaB family protein n=1 Tax=Nocardia sp. NBC_00511 TaxID=2903591 RepID=UPI00386AEEF5
MSPAASHDSHVHQPAPSRTISAHDRARFQRYTGTTMFALFAGAFFDQVMLPEVAAGVEWTGRIRNTPFERAIRTAAADQLVLVADDATRKAESERLLAAHRDVKGVGFNGVRFSALNPESWNWILISGIVAFQNAYTPITGEKLSGTEQQVFYEFLLEKFAHMQLPGKNSRLPAQYSELLRYYDELIKRKGETNIAVQSAVDTLLNAPLPPGLPAAAKPVWTPLARIVGQVGAVCSFGIMHPHARELTRFRWTRRHDIAFRVITGGLPIAYNRFPKRLTMSPLAYHRWHYEKHIERCAGVALTSFAPDPA